MRKAFWIALALTAALAPADAHATGAICHSDTGACRVEQTDDADVVEFSCSCSDLSEQSGELEADENGLFFACVTSLGVCGDDPVVLADDFVAPIDPPADDLDVEIDHASAGCRIGTQSSAWLAMLVLPLVWRRRA